MKTTPLLFSLAWMVFCIPLHLQAQPTDCDITELTAAPTWTCQPDGQTYDRDITVVYEGDQLPHDIYVMVNQGEFMVYSLTSSPQTITLYDLPADGAPVEVFVKLRDGCTFHADPLFTAPDGCATSPCEGNYFLRSQAEVDAFDCHAISGALIVEGEGITNLDGLSSLHTVGGYLDIRRNPDLISLEGLANLRTVGGDCYFTENDQLPNLNGLESLEEVAGRLFVQHNDNLRHIRGLRNLRVVDKVIGIVDNDRLEHLDGLGAVEEARDGLWVNENDALERLTDMPQLQTLGGHLAVLHNEQLLHLNGLEALEIVGGLRVENNPMLRQLNGLSGLRQVTGLVNVYHNLQLQNLDGLVNVEYVGENLWIHENYDLNSCCGLFTLFDEGEVGGNVFLASNGAGCTYQEVLDQGPCGACDITALSYGEAYDCDEQGQTYSRDLFITYEGAPIPASIQVMVNEGGFTDYPLTGSPQRIELTALPANGAPVEVFVKLEDGCTFHADPLFTAPDGCGLTVPPVSFSLMDADQDVPIPAYDPIPANAAIDLSSLPTRALSIRAKVGDMEILGMQFHLHGPQTWSQFEGVMPYALFGDVQGNYAPWIGGGPVAGTYTLDATPKLDGWTDGATTSLRFTFTEASQRMGQFLHEGLLQEGLQAYPNPFHHEVRVSTTDLESGSAQLQIMNLMGAVVFTREVELPLNALLSLDQLPRGMYILTLTTEHTRLQQRLQKQ